VRIWACLAAAALGLAGCAGSGGSGSYGDAVLSLGGRPSAEDSGIYLATQRGYDTADGVTLHVRERGAAEFRLLRRPEGRWVAVMAIVRPARLLLCVDRETLQDERDKVVAVVQALQRGYTQAQLEPDEAVAAMVAQVPGLDAARVSARMDDVAPTWSEGAPFLGQLAPGPGRDATIARPFSS
jgi:ABC-type nitrate/sulfonate/bicarbonate transport system substrate-binding protein